MTGEITKSKSAQLMMQPQPSSKLAPPKTDVESSSESLVLMTNAQSAFQLFLEFNLIYPCLSYFVPFPIYDTQWQISQMRYKKKVCDFTSCVKKHGKAVDMQIENFFDFLMY